MPYNDRLIAALPDDTDPAAWRKAEASNSFSNCVEVARLPHGEIGVRNSRFPDGPVLWYTPGEWAAFLDGVKNGEFDHFAERRVSTSGRALHRD